MRDLKLTYIGGCTIYVIIAALGSYGILSINLTIYTLNYTYIDFKKVLYFVISIKMTKYNTNF